MGTSVGGKFVLGDAGGIAKGSARGGEGDGV